MSPPPPSATLTGTPHLTPPTIVVPPPSLRSSPATISQPPLPPSLQALLRAYSLDVDADSGVLELFQYAKVKEEERLAALAHLRAEKLRAAGIIAQQQQQYYLALVSAAAQQQQQPSPRIQAPSLAPVVPSIDNGSLKRPRPTEHAAVVATSSSSSSFPSSSEQHSTFVGSKRAKPSPPTPPPPSRPPPSSCYRLPIPVVHPPLDPHSPHPPPPPLRSLPSAAGRTPSLEPPLPPIAAVRPPLGAVRISDARSDWAGG